MSITYENDIHRQSSLPTAAAQSPAMERTATSPPLGMTQADD
jgi:hypothetical protein